MTDAPMLAAIRTAIWRALLCVPKFCVENVVAGSKPSHRNCICYATATARKKEKSASEIDLLHRVLSRRKLLIFNNPKPSKLTVSGFLNRNDGRYHLSLIGLCEGNFERRNLMTNSTINLTFYDDEKAFRHLNFALRDFCILTEIVGTIFARVGGKYAHRFLLDSLIGIFKGRLHWKNRVARWFSASHETLIDQVKEFDHSRDAGDKKIDLQVIKRNIKNFMDVQEANGLDLIEYKQGSKGSGLSKPKSSEFKLKIIEYAMEAYYRASVNPEKYENKEPGSRWYHAAIEVADELPRKNLAKTKPKRRQSYDQQMRQAVGTMMSVGKEILENGGNDENVIELYKHILASSMGELTALQIGVDPLQAASPEGQVEASESFGKNYGKIDEFCNEFKLDSDDKSYIQ
jgi:hypothetical protein